MKRFTTIALAALMVLTVLVSVVPASAVDSVEVRGPVYNSTNLTTLFAADGMNDSGAFYLEMNETNFAGFFYEIDDDVATETLKIYNHSTVALTTGDRTLNEAAVIYTTTIQNVDYEFTGATGWTSGYSIMGLFADKYVPLDTDTPDKLAKLLVDNDKTYTMRTGQSVELAGGYAITAQQVDVEGNKVWMELTKDGVYLKDEVVNSNATWTFKPDVAGEEDVEVLRVYVKNVFQGQVDSLAVVKGIWLIDYKDIREIDSDDEFGALEVTDIGGDYLELKNKNSITLTKNSVKNIAEGMQFKIADSTELRFYLMKEYTDAGTYEVRGNVVINNTAAVDWDYSEFAGFFYDLDENEATEKLTITTALNGALRTIDDGELVYNTTIENVAFEFTGATGWTSGYNIMGLFAEKYVPLDDDTPDKLAKLLVDNDKTYTMRTGQAVELAGGYAITAQQVDVEGSKVWMELTKDGEYLKDEVVNANATWTFKPDVAGEEDVEVLRVYVKNVFQGQVDSLAVVKGIWLIDYKDIREIDSDDEFGALEVDDIGTDTLTMKNKNSITLTSNSVKDIAEGMKFRVADDSVTLRYYPFVEYTIGEVDEEEPAEPAPAEPAPAEPAPAEPAPAEPAPAEPAPAEPAPAEPAPAVEEPEIEAEPPEEEPGFEAIFAIAGLLAVAYLVRRN